MDKSERYLKEIAKNTAEIAKELKKMNRKDKVEFNINGETIPENARLIYEETLSDDSQGEDTGYVYKYKE